MDMDHNDGDVEYTFPNIVNAESKTFHWLLTLFLSLILPSVAAVLILAERFHTGVVLQIVSLAYCGFDVLFLSFPDGDGVENRTSRGTGVFLLLLSGVTVFVGLINSGSNFISSRDKSSLKWITQVSDVVVKKVHYLLSVLLVLTGWVKTCLAPAALFGFCREAHTGQCIAHGIMGSAFVWYGFVYAMILVVPYFKDPTIKQSQEFYDSLLMLAWGIVNTFTEHRWGQEWSMSDYQHTVNGILWWAGGLLGLFLSRGGRRSFMPALMLIFTGWAMSEHSQHLEISTKIHYMFGLALIVGGVIRICEIAFLVKDQRSLPNAGINSFQLLTPFSLIEAGILFMGANEEQLELVLRLGSEHSAYILLLTAAAFIVYLWQLLLLTLYLKLTQKNDGFSLGGYSSVENGNHSGVSNTEFELDNLSE
jgi:hypothetical protein